MSFKNASHNQQSRVDRAAQFSRVNESGVDPDAYATSQHETPPEQDDNERTRLELRRMELVQEKQALERKMSQIKTDIGKAVQAHRYGRGTALSHAAFNALHIAKEETQHALNAKQIEISQLNYTLKKQTLEFKISRRQQKEERKFSFEAVFVQVAQQILAKPVYERVAAATIHRIGEMKYPTDDGGQDESDSGSQGPP